ncbi:hypothetical protein [Leucobacter ruminantium]|uniref:Uncharacterized protein n=1 Tax=Leucobacter ruminantium TaxID=1289170 RepID=A0A939LWY9_9MICO|nr:hypothetical protein [Leucobacter ruminantium]MBO1805961.1 hypothetical protein [Leucobacter ruminantium]
MALKPPNFQWLGFTEEQIELLDFTDFIGNNGWARNSQTEEVMPNHLNDCAEANLGIDRIVEAMKAIGYTRDDLHMLRRWESKRTTGKFGK